VIFKILDMKCLGLSIQHFWPLLPGVSRSISAAQGSMLDMVDS